jgi:hypothetical protein
MSLSMPESIDHIRPTELDTSDVFPMQSVMEGMMKNVLCGLVLALFVLTVAAVYAKDAPPRTNCPTPTRYRLVKVPVRLQPKDLPWCTVASVQMAYAFYDKTDDDQFKQCKLAGRKTGETCCPDYLTLNTPEVCFTSAFWPEDWFKMSPPFNMNYQEVYPESSYDPPALSWEDLKDQIFCKKQPLIFVWKDRDGFPDHALIAVGYREIGGERYVRAHDPLVGYRRMLYETFVDGPQGEGHFEDYAEIFPIGE